MPQDKRENLASGSRALRRGGKALAKITGQPEPEIKQRNVLADGFRRLTGSVDKPQRRFGSP